ncbi:MAG: UxaA family hydrolase [Firmicutes bacterium]|nr:UxaA family hydrolase [Bacillota bacterium]
MKDCFYGFPRPDGSYGIRNHVLILPASRNCNYMAHRINSVVDGTKAVITLGEYGRTTSDRQRLFRFLTGLGCNPNVGAVLVLGDAHDDGHAEFDAGFMAQKIQNETQKPVVHLYVDDAGGLECSIGKGIGHARTLVQQVSRIFRENAPLGKLQVGVKCGASDYTSGIAGNKLIGYIFDRIVNAGGKAVFSETVEVIGAEHILAKRAVSRNVAEKLLEYVRKTESEIQRTGEDVRRINPIPENITGGITTLEEKSLGAIVKSGTAPLSGVLDYCERPHSPGLYFMHGWMHSYSLMPSLAAAGCQIVFYQLGVQEGRCKDPVNHTVDPALISPMLYTTANPLTADNMQFNLDFDASALLSGKLTLEDIGEKLLTKTISVASGELSAGETLNYNDPLDVFFDGPFL